MLFESIPGNHDVKKRLVRTVTSGKIAHAQLFAGKPGGNGLPLALAYASMLTCESPTDTGACGRCSACLKNKSFVHPDVHFIMPLSSTATYTGDDVISKNFLKPWRAFLNEHPYGNINDWVEFFGGGKKQPIIAKRENVEIIEALSLKPFESLKGVFLLNM
jgi:DNA polymerase-3 subunit delta'